MASSTRASALPRSVVTRPSIVPPTSPARPAWATSTAMASPASAPTWSDWRLRTQRELLHSPAAELSHPQLVVDAAVDRVGDVELLRQLPRPAESTHELPVQIELVDLSVHVE